MRKAYCGDRVAAYALANSPPVSHGDGNPLTICVLTDRPISRIEILLDTRPSGGLRMVGRGEPTTPTLFPADTFED